MAIKTTQEQLEEVQTAISNVMDGQEVTYHGKTWRLADLDKLSQREEILLARYHRESGGGMTIVTGLLKRD
jgi:hypothetical protein